MLNMEIRNNELTIKGYINAVERDSREIPSPQGTFVEQVKAGVWTRSLANKKDISLLLNHDYTRKLGSVSQGNVTLKEDTIGLHAELRTMDAEVVEKARNNKLVGWSFGFNKNKDSWGKTDAGIARRYLEDIDLVEVSLLDDTRIPAYVGTSIESRDNKEVMIEQRFVKDDIEIKDDSKEVEQRQAKAKEENLKRRLLIELEL